MKQFLIKTSANWADEIDLHGWIILDENYLAAKVETGFDG